MRRVTLGLFVLLSVCVSCAAPRYQIPQTESELQSSVSQTEASYMLLYGAHKSGEISKPAMANVDILYEAYRRSAAWMADAMRAGAVTLKGE